ncbi:MAG: outer membrane beta-barrel protein [Planctomycetales bacterium]|nr:outer membrane beta-barrel protein [Planctomycetales bacterium]
MKIVRYAVLLVVLLCSLSTCSAQEFGLSPLLDCWENHLDNSLLQRFLPDPCSGKRVYKSFAYGSSNLTADSDIPQTSDSDDDAFMSLSAIGIEHNHCHYATRFELEGGVRSQANWQFSPGSAPIVDARIDDVWSLATNVWIDVPLTERISLFGGGGVGAATADISVQSGAVNGGRDMFKFLYQAGTGLTYHCSHRLHLDVGYRYLNLGNANLDLFNGNTPAGNVSLDIDANEFYVGFRLLH